MSKQKQSPLTMEEIQILLKSYYIGKNTLIALEENITTNRVRYIRERALRLIRMSYSPLYRMGIPFEGERVLQHMADLCHMDIQDLNKLYAGYIHKGLMSKDKKYWQDIKPGAIPSSAELLDFIYNKLERQIIGTT